MPAAWGVDGTGPPGRTPRCFPSRPGQRDLGVSENLTRAIAESRSALLSCLSPREARASALTLVARSVG